MMEDHKNQKPKSESLSIMKLVRHRFAALAVLVMTSGAYVQVVQADLGNYVDSLCSKFCEDFYATCVNQNYYDKKAKGLPTPSINGALPRTAQDSFAGIQDCQAQCMKWPRPLSPDLYTNPLAFGTNLGGDSLWCRQRHLSLAVGTFNEAAFHCLHADPSGGGICTDSLVNGYTPGELLRTGQLSRHHFFYCDLAANDTIADCTHMGISDATLPFALQYMPSTVQVIFLNDNPAITELPANIFANNLKNPTNIQVLTFDECNIKSIDADAFEGLWSLKVLNLNMNNITSIPDGMLSHSPNLMQLSLFTSGSKLASLTSVPETLFSNTPNIERIIMFGHSSLTSFPQNFFKGLTKCKIISFVNSGFDNAGFPDGVFKDLTSLLYFDFLGCKLTSVEKRWFDGGWGAKIVRLALYGNDITSIEANAFDTLVNLQGAHFHDNPVTQVPTNLFVNNKKLIHVAIQGP